MNTNDYGHPTTRRYPRNLQSAFGPHTSSEIEEEEEPTLMDRVIEFVCIAASAVLVLWACVLVLRHGYGPL